MIEAILFDYNGVLVDDEGQHYESLRTVLAGEEIPLSRDVYYADYMGFDDRRCVVEAFRRAGRTLAGEVLERLVARKSAAYAALVEHDLPLVPGAAEFVTRAADRFRLAVVSGAQRAEIVSGLERAGLADRFEAIIAAEDVRRCKPDPEGYVAAHAALARRGRLPAAGCVVLEDSLPGLAAARAAGMPCAMLATSLEAAALRAAGADVVWTTLADRDPADLLALNTR